MSDYVDIGRTEGTSLMAGGSQIMADLGGSYHEKTF